MTLDLIILGNLGSLGSELSRYFESKFNVIGIDLGNVDLMNSDSLVKFLEGESKLNRSRAVVINAAGIMGAKESQINPLQYFERNGVLPYLTRKAIGKIYEKLLYVQISSETVYGASNNIEEIYNEESSCNPLHNYAVSKLIGEQLLAASQDETTKTLILRVPIVIFAPQKYPNALTEMTNEIISSKKATIFGEGSHIRNYVTVEILLFYVEAILEEYIARDKCDNGVERFNIPGLSISPNDYLNELKRKFDFKRVYVDGGKSGFSLLTSSQKFQAKFPECRHKQTLEHLAEYIVGSYE